MSRDGGSTSSQGAYAPPSKTIAMREALARCDHEQAKQIRAWSERIEAAVAADPARCVHDLRALAEEMKNTAAIVEHFTAEILKKIGESK